MKAKKLPSGNYRVRLSIGKNPETGKYDYKSFTAETAKEAERLAYDYLYTKQNVEQCPKSLTLEKAMEEYNESKRNILSPTTYVEYERTRRLAFGSISHIPVCDITNNIVQKWANEQSLGIAPKTLRNRYNYLTALLRVYAPDLKLTVSLPKRKKADIHVVTDDEMRILLKATEGTELGLAVRLAAFIPARRSEICAICPRTDVKDNFITINKALVKDEYKDWIIKQPKSYAGYRTVEMPPEIIKLIPKGAEKAVNLNPDQLYKALEKKLKELGLSFRLHDLRHYGATFLHAQGVPDKYIMQRGGWNSVATLQDIYTHCLPQKTDEATKTVISKLNSLMD